VKLWRTAAEPRHVASGSTETNATLLEHPYTGSDRQMLGGAFRSFQTGDRAQARKLARTNPNQTAHGARGPTSLGLSRCFLSRRDGEGAGNVLRGALPTAVSEPFQNIDHCHWQLRSFQGFSWRQALWLCAQSLELPTAPRGSAETGGGLDTNRRPGHSGARAITHSGMHPPRHPRPGFIDPGRYAPRPGSPATGLQSTAAAPGTKTRPPQLPVE